MKNILKLSGFILGLLAMLTMNSCKEVDPAIEKYDFKQAFMPINLRVIVDGQAIEADWDVAPDVESYNVQIVAGQNVEVEQNITLEDIPFIFDLKGDTEYEFKVQSVISGKDGSKWATFNFRTAAEQLFEQVTDCDITITSATLNWVANAEVTKLEVTTESGSTDRPISAAEITAGEVVVTGLLANTDYTVTLYNGEQKRGMRSFITYRDYEAEGFIIVPDDYATVSEAIENGGASPQIAVRPGNYAESKIDQLNKGFTVCGMSRCDMPVITGMQMYARGGAAGDILFENVILDGDDPNESYYIIRYRENLNFGELVFKSCEVRNYSRGIYGNGSELADGTVKGIIIDDCVFTDVTYTGSEFIDFRGGYVEKIELKNSTFDNVGQSRAFFRLDATDLSETGKTTSITVNNCTFYKITDSDGGSKGVFSTKFADHTIDVKNSIFANSRSNFVNETTTGVAPINFAGNYYFEATSLLSYDVSGEEQDPGFVDAENGDFTLTNKDLIYLSVGDPHWLPVK